MKRLTGLMIFIIVLSIGTVVFANEEQEKTVDNFIRYPDQEFNIKDLVTNQDLFHALYTLVDNRTLSRNQLIEAIEQNDGKLSNQYIFFYDDDYNENDFKIFTDIELKSLKVYFQTENTKVLKSEYLTHLEDLTVQGNEEVKELDLSQFNNLESLFIETRTESEHLINTILPEFKNNLESLMLENVQLDSLILKDLESLSFVRLEDSKVDNIHFEHTDQLSSLHFSFNEVGDFTFKNSNLEYSDFYFYNNTIDNLTINNVNGIEVLDLDYMNLKSLYIENANDLLFIHYFGDYDNRQLESLTLKNLPSLESIGLINTKLRNMDLQNLPKLTQFSLSRSELGNIDFTDPIFDNLKYLEFSESGLTKVNLSSLTKLEELILRDNKLTEIDVNKLKNLKSLDLTGNKLRTIDLTSLNKLRELNISNNNFSTIDLKNQTDLFQFWAYSNKFTSLKPLKDVLDTVNVVIIYDNEINLLSKENKPIHKHLKNTLTGHNWGFGDHYQYDSQRVKQVDEKSSSSSKQKDGKASSESKVTTDKQTGIIKQVIVNVATNQPVKLLNSNSKIIFPSNMDEDAKLSVQSISSKKVEQLLANTPYRLAGDIFEFNFKDNDKITEPFTLELYFDKDKYPTDEWEIGIYYYNENTNEWELQDSVIDEENSIVRAEVDHFSIYGVLAKPKNEILPNTATNNYTYLAFGSTLLVIGLVTFLLTRRRKYN